jgi:hypothetical protein
MSEDSGSGMLLAFAERTDNINSWEGKIAIMSPTSQAVQHHTAAASMFENFWKTKHRSRSALEKTIQFSMKAIQCDDRESIHLAHRYNRLAEYVAARWQHDGNPSDSESAIQLDKK